MTTDETTTDETTTDEKDPSADTSTSSVASSGAISSESSDEKPATPSTGLRSPVVRMRRFSRKRVCPLSGDGAPEVDYKDIALLQRYISERGKIIPSRLSGVSRKKQHELAAAVKRARFLALLPYIAR